MLSRAGELSCCEAPASLESAGMRLLLLLYLESNKKHRGRSYRWLWKKLGKIAISLVVAVASALIRHNVASTVPVTYAQLESLRMRPLGGEPSPGANERKAPMVPARLIWK